MMSNQSPFDLKKKVEFVLTKRNLNNLECNVAFVSDVSGSMHHHYISGLMQKLYDRIFAISLKCDVDKQVDSFIFDDRGHQIETISEDNINDYVNNHILKTSINIWNGTEFSQVINKVINNYYSSGFMGFGKKVPKFPIMVNFLTDGVDSNKLETIKNIEHSQKYNIYWNMFGLGNSDFSFIESLADKYPNVGFVEILNLDKITDEELYEKIFNEEFCIWIKK